MLGIGPRVHYLCPSSFREKASATLIGGGVLRGESIAKSPVHCPLSHRFALIIQWRHAVLATLSRSHCLNDAVSITLSPSQCVCHTVLMMLSRTDLVPLSRSNSPVRTCRCLVKPHSTLLELRVVCWTHDCRASRDG